MPDYRLTHRPSDWGSFRNSGAHTHGFFWSGALHGSLESISHFKTLSNGGSTVEELIELGESFPTIQNLGVGEPPFHRNLASKLKL